MVDGYHFHRRRESARDLNVDLAAWIERIRTLQGRSLRIFRLDNFFFFQAEDGIRDLYVTGVQTCALPILLLHSPPLAERMLQFVKFNRGGTVVEPRLLSHAILASVRERDAHYVWAAQVGAARRAGVPEGTIDLLRAKGDPTSLAEDERDIITFTRQLVRSNRVDQPIFDRLQKRHGTQ